MVFLFVFYTIVTHYSAEHFQIYYHRAKRIKKRKENKTSSSLCDNKAGYKTFFYAIVIPNM